VHEDTLVVVHGLVNECKDFITGFVLGVEKHLIFLIEPVVGEVLHPNVGPLVLHLTARAVYDLSHLVRHHEFEVLGRERVANEKPIFYFYGSNHVFLHV
jgi:hypothetical protein